MPIPESDLVPISALQHVLFCERQCALIHIEGAWAENRLTAEGRLLHERVHAAGAERRGDLRIARGLRLRSLRLGLTGIADVVEFRRVGPDGGGIPVPGWRDRWAPSPVEYKRGRRKPDDCDRVQLCAQALCLEEMLDASIPEAALFYGQPRRREAVTLDAALREKTADAAARVHRLLADGELPAPRRGKHCEACSLRDMCLPGVAAGRGRVEAYLEEALRE